jgi:hypothetical protein
MMNSLGLPISMGPMMSLSLSILAMKPFRRSST